MKKFSYVLMAVCLFSVSASAQSNSEKLPAWLSEKGYWVIESNVKTPRSSIVHFYNNDNVVVYREKVEGVKLNLNRKKTLMRLKTALDQAFNKWELTKQMKENDTIVARALKTD